MPSRKRGQEAKRAARAAERRKHRSKRKPKRSRKRRNARGGGSVRHHPDPSDVPEAQVRFIQPADATKTYRCPGCNSEIPPGLGHMVVVPPDNPDLRRHWHRGCWTNRHGRY